MSVEEVVMKYEAVNMFPSTVYIGEIEGHIEHKKVFYDKIYPEYDYPYDDMHTVSEEQGKPTIHTEESAAPMMMEITKHIKNFYLNVLGLKDIFDVYHTKTWLSRSRSGEGLIPTHIHSPSHISYVYYLNVPEGSPHLTFIDIKNVNEVFTSCFESYPDEDTFMNGYTFESTKTYSIESTEGTICIFPSKTPHGTDSVSEVFSDERLAISGDCIITLKESERMKYSVGHINPKYWRRY